MSRIAQSGIDGISIRKIELPSGRIVYQAKVRAPTGQYESTNYPNEKEARRGGIETLRRFNQAANNAAAASQACMVAASPAPAPVPAVPASPPPALWFAPLARDYAAMQRVMERQESRARTFEHLATAIEREGFGNLFSGTFGKDVLTWLKNLKCDWSNTDPNWKGRKKNKTELTMRYRNDLLEKINCAISFYMGQENSLLFRTPLMRKNGSSQLWKFPVPNKLKPTFQIHELRAMVSNDMAHDPWWLPACLTIYTGCRAQEAFFLRWENFDWEARIIRLQFVKEKDIKSDNDKARYKTGERIIPLQQELYETLQKIGPKPYGFLIEDEYLRSNGSIKKIKRTKPTKHSYTAPMKLYCKRCGIDPSGRTMHSLRHNYAAIMLAMGHQFNEVMDAMGHCDEETTLEYARMRSTFTTAVKHWPKGEYQLRADVPTTVPLSSSDRSISAPPASPHTAAR